MNGTNKKLKVLSFTSPESTTKFVNLHNIQVCTILYVPKEDKEPTFSSIKVAPYKLFYYE